MKIFSGYPQAASFAYGLESAPGEGGASHASMVKLALTNAGVNVPGVLLDAPTLDMIGEFAEKLRMAVLLGMPRYESKALIAVHSHDWQSKRASVEVLKPYFRGALSGMAGDARLVDKLVTRHYLAQRDRGTGWSIEEIAREFGAGLSRVTNLDTMVVTIAENLLAEGYLILGQRIGLPTLEAEHA